MPTGLDKIIKEITDEANDKATALITDAKLTAHTTVERAEQKAEKDSADITEKAFNDYNEAFKRYMSSADLKKRQAVLETRQEIILETIEKAKAAVLNLSDEKYFELFESVLKRLEPKKGGVLLFNEKDKERLPKDFLEKSFVSTPITISDECRKIDGGFILSYGGIEENCSVSALFDTKKDELCDKVNKYLFD